MKDGHVIDLNLPLGDFTRLSPLLMISAVGSDAQLIHFPG